jgi:23S rRNA pseudouridine2605 synthase
VKLNVYLARCGVASRRRADELIKKGDVEVNRTKVTVPFLEITPEDSVTVYGRPVSPEKYVYIVLNKPVGYTSTVKDRFAEKKVTDLIPKSYGRLFPVGRLDKNSSGLLILTNDGEFANHLTHPRYQVEKEYEVTVSPAFNNLNTKVLKKGITEGGEKLRAASIKSLKTLPGRSKLAVVMKEGKKREIRRLFEALGYGILELKRVRIGSIRLGSLKSGEYRLLTNKEKQFGFTPSCPGEKQT